MKKVIVITIVGILLAACSSRPASTLLDLTMTATSDLNPDLANRPSPMVVKLVEMKSHTAFENADYFALVGNTKNVLGPEYVAEEDLPIRPGEEKQFKLRLHAGSRFIGVIAEYRALDKAIWRYVLQPQKEDHTDIHLSLTKDAIRLMNREQENNKKQ
jgi:type VI secretion lipoprotein, VC_A0113 family